MSDILLYTHFKPFENKMKKISQFGSINKANLLLLSFHELVLRQEKGLIK